MLLSYWLLRLGFITNKFWLSNQCCESYLVLIRILNAYVLCLLWKLVSGCCVAASILFAQVFVWQILTFALGFFFFLITPRLNLVLQWHLLGILKNTSKNNLVLLMHRLQSLQVVRLMDPCSDNPPAPKNLCAAYVPSVFEGVCC